MPYVCQRASNLVYPQDRFSSAMRMMSWTITWITLGRPGSRRWVIAFLVPRMFGVTDESSATTLNVVRPFQSADFRFSPRRMEREPHNVPHRHAGTLPSFLDNFWADG